MSIRVDRWEVILHEEVDKSRLVEFSWGSHDCATWAFDIAAKITGAESSADLWRGGYSTSVGAVLKMNALGWNSLEEMASGLLGERLQSPTFAQRGDIVLSGDPLSFGVCVGASAAQLSEGGLIFTPMKLAKMAWRV